MAYCDSCLVRNTAICAALDAKEIEALNQIGRRRWLKPGESLAWEGDDSILVANVIEGVLQLTSGTEDGRTQVVGVVYPSDFVGRPYGDTNNQSITAVTASHVCVFDRANFDRFAAQHPALEHKLLRRTLAELDRTREWMLLLSRKTAQARVASFLLEMAERIGTTGCAQAASDDAVLTFALPFTRQQIGDIVGLTIETVSRQMSTLRREGVIALPSRKEIRILDRDRLQVLAS